VNVKWTFAKVVFHMDVTHFPAVIVAAIVVVVLIVLLIDRRMRRQHLRLYEMQQRSERTGGSDRVHAEVHQAYCQQTCKDVKQEWPLRTSACDGRRVADELVLGSEADRAKAEHVAPVASVHKPSDRQEGQFESDTDVETQDGSGGERLPPCCSSEREAPLQPRVACSPLAAHEDSAGRSGPIIRGGDPRTVSAWVPLAPLRPAPPLKPLSPLPKMQVKRAVQGGGHFSGAADAVVAHGGLGGSRNAGVGAYADGDRLASPSSPVAVQTAPAQPGRLFEVQRTLPIGSVGYSGRKRGAKPLITI
jgi:hypothetical protein